MFTSFILKRVMVGRHSGGCKLSAPSSCQKIRGEDKFGPMWLISVLVENNTEMATLQQACFLVISQVFSDNRRRRLSVTSSVIRCSLRRNLAAGFEATDCVDRLPAMILGGRCCCCCYCCEYPCLRRSRLARRVCVNHRRTRRAVDASIGGEYGERWSDSIATTTTAAVATTLAATTNEDGATVPTPLPLSLEEVQSRPLLGSWKPPRYLWRALAAFIIAGQVSFCFFLISPPYSPISGTIFNLLSFPSSFCNISLCRGSLHWNDLERLEWLVSQGHPFDGSQGNVVSLEHLSFQFQHKIPELERLNWRELRC
jgi:hypothetical protein